MQHSISVTMLFFLTWHHFSISPCMLFVSSLKLNCLWRFSIHDDCNKYNIDRFVCTYPFNVRISVPTSDCVSDFKVAYCLTVVLVQLTSQLNYDRSHVYILHEYSAELWKETSSAEEIISVKRESMQSLRENLESISDRQKLKEKEMRHSNK